MHFWITSVRGHPTEGLDQLCEFQLTKTKCLRFLALGTYSYGQPLAEPLVISFQVCLVFIRPTNRWNRYFLEKSVFCAIFLSSHTGFRASSVLYQLFISPGSIMCTKFVWKLNVGASACVWLPILDISLAAYSPGSPKLRLAGQALVSCGLLHYWDYSRKVFNNL